ncbi:MAG: hypothetical protein LBQ60_06410 [Bacteroidales bacterium]|jgi:hypothetical protein|nr:hypothetical protein [Bacteroidales bacterium]
MKTVRLLFILLQIIIIFPPDTKAQDFLVTINRDTLNCRLGKLEKDQYPITFFVDNEKIHGYIHKDSILFLKKNVFQSLRNNKLLPWYPLRDINIDAGVAHQFGTFRFEDDLTSKSNFAARTGFYANVDMVYYLSDTV